MHARNEHSYNLTICLCYACSYDPWMILYIVRDETCSYGSHMHRLKHCLMLELLMMMHHPIIMSHSVTNVLVATEEEKKKYLTAAEARRASFLLFLVTAVLMGYCCLVFHATQLRDHTRINVLVRCLAG